MLTKDDLKRWIEFLQEQIVDLNAFHLEVTGTSHRASPELVAFLKINDALVKERVEHAVIDFSKTETWPRSLKRDEIVNLTHRVNAARGLFQAMFEGRKFGDLAPLKIPRTGARAQMIQWLLIDNWNMAGGAYIYGLTASFLG